MTILVVFALAASTAQAAKKVDDRGICKGIADVSKASAKERDKGTPMPVLLEHIQTKGGVDPTSAMGEAVVRAVTWVYESKSSPAIAYSQTLARCRKAFTN